MAATMRSLRIGGREFHWGTRTYLMGIVNVTPDSFSGDGVTDLKKAVGQASQMELDGAELIDIGGESTRPETWVGPGLSSDEELARVIPVLEQAVATVTVPISIDTYKAAVAERAIAAGAAMVNEVWGLRRDPRMAATVAGAGVPVVLMRSEEHTSELQSPYDLVCRLLLEKKNQCPIPTDLPRPPLPTPRTRSTAPRTPSNSPTPGTLPPRRARRPSRAASLAARAWSAACS